LARRHGGALAVLVALVAGTGPQAGIGLGHAARAVAAAEVRPHPQRQAATVVTGAFPEAVEVVLARQ
jgi:hypothetical protein